MTDLTQQIKELRSQILFAKLQSPFHPEINKLQAQLDELYARQSTEQA
jgi:hypothetical protein